MFEWPQHFVDSWHAMLCELCENITQNMSIQMNLHQFAVKQFIDSMVP